MNTGGKWNFGEFTVKCTAAQHSSGLPDGSYGGNPMGFIVTSNEGSFYYSGDTALTTDMTLIPKWAKLNFAVLPIGDNFTMDASDAAECAGMIDCKKSLVCIMTLLVSLRSIMKKLKKHLQIKERVVIDQNR